jgi:hypothetical protein
LPVTAPSLRRLRAGAYVAAEQRIVHERVFEAGADVTIGADEAAGLVVPSWVGPPLLLISGGNLLHLAPGMRVNMCDEAGGARIIGTFEELTARGEALPIAIQLRRMNIRVRDAGSQPHGAS